MVKAKQSKIKEYVFLVVFGLAFLLVGYGLGYNRGFSKGYHTCFSDISKYAQQMRKDGF